MSQRRKPSPTIEEMRADVVRVARSWVGTPYLHRGRIKGVGTDCGMSLIEIFAEAGVIESFDPGEYPSDWMLHREEERYLGIVERFTSRRMVDNPLPGDIALFKFGRCISHGGVLVEDGMLVHAYAPSRCVVLDEIERTPRLRNTLVGYWSCWSS
ncbi:MAG: C40 family peptidase [Alphaproteobacteria bacterium]|nr:C40 family peptidase [Alphaproteobacteria bacterium]